MFLGKNNFERIMGNNGDASNISNQKQPIPTGKMGVFSNTLITPLSTSKRP